MSNDPSPAYQIQLPADGTTPYNVSVWKLTDSGGTAQPVKLGYLSYKAYGTFYYATIEPNNPSPMVFVSKSGYIESNSSYPFMMGVTIGSGSDESQQWLYSGVNYVEFSSWLSSDSALEILENTIQGSSNQAYIWTFYYTNTPTLSTAGTPVYLTYGYLPGLYFDSSSPLIGLPNEDTYLPVEAAGDSIQNLLIFMIEPTVSYSICYSSGCTAINYSDDWICGPLGEGSYCLGPDDTGAMNTPIAPNCGVCASNPPPPPPPPPPLPGADTVWSFIDWRVIGISIGVAVGAIFVSIVRYKNRKDQEALEASSSSESNK